MDQRDDRYRENKKIQKGVGKTILKRRRGTSLLASACCSASSWHCGTPPKT